MHRFRLGALRPRGTVTRAMAVTGLVAICTTAANGAEDQATLRLRGVIQKTVSVSFGPPSTTDSGHFSGPYDAVRIDEQSNFASRYRMYLESTGTGDLEHLTFDGVPVVFREKRALLESRGLGRDLEVSERGRVLAFANDGRKAAREPLFLVVSTY